MLCVFLFASEPILLSKQEQNLAKGLQDIKQRQMASFLTSIEKGLNQTLQEKDIEIKNKELVERIKQLVAEDKNWHYRAKYNELVVNVLKNRQFRRALTKQGRIWR